MPSSPMRLAAGTRSPSKKISVVWWLIIVSSGRIVSARSSAPRRSTRNSDSPSVRFFTASSGVVRASSSIRSECSARLVQIFWPVITYASPSRAARVWMRVVSDPAVGSVTPKACSRSFPSASGGSQRAFCRADPCRASAPITYICAWQTPAFPPLRLTSSRITDASAIDAPPPPYSSGISAAKKPAPVIASTNSTGYPRSASSRRQYGPGKRAHSWRTPRRSSGYCPLVSISMGERDIGVYVVDPNVKTAT